MIDAGSAFKATSFAPFGKASVSTGSSDFGVAAEATRSPVDSCWLMGAGANSLIGEPVSGLKRRTMPSEPAAARALPSGLKATE